MKFDHLRIARPVSELERSSGMYCRGLGLKKVGEFSDHDGFSGCMLGRDDLSWHLEFTVCHSHPILPSPSQEDLLVLYIPDKIDWHNACARMDDAGFSRLGSFNPYWNNNGVTFVDVDGYRVVLHNAAWGSP
ncbi:VOC family protein [Pantoea sp. T14]|jgi:hypothetical protein|uniref:VOC family protein n=1 Tax=Pantoea TaxID=53335 RepID=UPI002FC77166